MQITYLNHEDFDIDTTFFQSFLVRLAEETLLLKGILNVVFVNDAYIQALNKSYRGKDKPTDVLSFNYETDGDDFVSSLVGEVYISVETAKRQAFENGHSLLDELIKLIVHGVLHVHGFDHEQDDDYQKMFAIEKAVLADIAGEFIE